MIFFLFRFWNGTGLELTKLLTQICNICRNFNVFLQRSFSYKIGTLWVTQQLTSPFHDILLKSTLSLNNLKILLPKVTRNITNLCKKFCESPPWWCPSLFVWDNKVRVKMLIEHFHLNIYKWKTFLTISTYFFRYYRGKT